MVYLSLFFSLFYLMSCPILAIANINGLDDLYGLYPMIEAVSYIFYLINNLRCDSNSMVDQDDKRTNNEQLKNEKLNRCFNVFNILYVIFLLTISYTTKNVVILCFALYPLGLKVVFVDMLYVNFDIFKEFKKMHKIRNEENI